MEDESSTSNSPDFADDSTQDYVSSVAANGAKEEIFKSSLPLSYKYEVHSFEGTAEKYVAVVRVNISSIQEGDDWIRCFERVSKTNWSVRRTYPHLEKLIRKDYVCHLKNYRGRPTKGRKSVDKVKFNGCPARISIKIKPVTKSTLLRYKWVREGLPATIHINFTHNHVITSAEQLSYRKLDPTVRSMFANYFMFGMSAEEAAKYHRRRIETDPDIGNPSIALEDAARNPKKQTVSYLYTLWRERKLEEPTIDEIVDDEQPSVRKLYNEDDSHFAESSNEEEHAARSRSSTVIEAWRALSAKIERRLKYLAPRDPDILQAIDVIDKRLVSVSNYRQFLNFLQSADVAAAAKSSAELASSSAHPTASVLTAAANPAIDLPAVAASAAAAVIAQQNSTGNPTTIAPMVHSLPAMLVASAPCAAGSLISGARRKQPRPKRMKKEIALELQKKQQMASMPIVIKQSIGCQLTEPNRINTAVLPSIAHPCGVTEPVQLPVSVSASPAMPSSVTLPVPAASLPMSVSLPVPVLPPNTILTNHGLPITNVVPQPQTQCSMPTHAQTLVQTVQPMANCYQGGLDFPYPQWDYM